ncbi:MAG: mandelate racemase/muconate lactonizing enzyme family protein [Spirochaetales bacterium]|nr:mandelate racemase/muconate lactonizing enzyme family protein [Spirochaetales bacterium]
MKLVDCQFYVVKNQCPMKGGPHWYLVKLVSDDGIEGWGEMWWNGLSPQTFIKIAEEVADRFVMGQSPFHVEKMFQRFFKQVCFQHSDLTKMGIWSGLEVACWDIQGKASNRPVYELLGGLVNDKLRSYSYIYPEDPEANHMELWANPEAVAKRALDYVDQGFTAIKLDPVDIDQEGIAPPWHASLPVLERAEKTIAAIRDAVGGKCDIIIGTHGQYTAASAVRFISRMEKYDPLWFEEPVPPENPTQMARVNAVTRVPVAAGERLTTKYELASLMTGGAADIIQLDLGGVGGLLEAKKIAGMAEAFHMQITPHFWAGPVMYAAQSQLAACSPNFIIQEVIERMDGFHAELVKNPFIWDEGYMRPSELPGLGIEIDEKKVSEHSLDIS